MKLRTKHSETIQQLKAQFLRDKREYQQDSENKISSLERKANTVSFPVIFVSLEPLWLSQMSSFLLSYS